MIRLRYRAREVAFGWSRGPALWSTRRLESMGSTSWRVPSTNKAVAQWLYGSAAVVGCVVVVGGVTRLTESGLSIVDWKPVTGVRPPTTQDEWEEEFAKYQNFPEFKQRNTMTLEEFKFIFFWEWAHRVLARSVGIVYGVPLLYFVCRGRFRAQPALLATLSGILALGGAQGAMGWYMVRSGLDPQLLDERRKARVSTYRLAAHLVLAFTIYASLMRVGFGLKMPRMAHFPGRTRIQACARCCFAAVLCTVISGAFVAGLGGGLMYNDELPWMGGGFIPPRDHLMVVEPWWRNALENPAAAQTWHRLMAAVSTTAIMAMNATCFRYRVAIPLSVWKSVAAVNAMLIAQVSLGVWTIASYVDLPVAVSHQLGSLLLLTTTIRVCAVLGSRGLVLV
ncbi:cytochrome oxidase assembly protein, putative [Trypanosoma equiperdum]|uniref:Cytochrome oxidase assembly protein, putative n=4 Tax=Trypanozoon TaxID=39700 RepID=Q382Y6_TRYB2|nr:cytochrome oxidase assembly protein, putative [Trypanosoma brucei gambiense DAL972]XP_829257.1 cytochrome oxidase assembly protein, putative [Trypanosoma brucei brucei TREU927]RHW67697.1 cytochrome oxidase assembly protein [Trypanosoma brucei equiperdum]SCU65775.1 cytochrome oxidase assembly protein, putative [Trypanosoma equiperdum]EAN80145.1 cytochrome oxidase assembly protein, putative [Trypanosoma brucei brucei TREU927]CBH18222.1 cytochrome oxidase assembly protein, putative [Trypanosom|eukprot:XP_011780486.1 cytochrome oxidase assembly protein, putative [Trypanosoma brucei gambiense DAL972]